MSSFKYMPKPAAAIAVIILFVIANVLFFGRTIPWLRIAPITDLFPGFYSHISNFSLTFEMTLFVSVMWVLLDVKLNVLLMLFATAIIVNVLVESSLTILNTPDMVDALYGVVAVVMAGMVSLIIRQYGIVKRMPEREVDQ